MGDERESELDIFVTAIEMEPLERERFLRKACQDDVDLRFRIDRLIALDEQAEQSKFLAPALINVKDSLDQASDDSSLIHREIGPFRIVKKVGGGGMGEVYMARRITGYKQDVAIKVLRRVVETDEMLRRFESEAQFTAALGKHPNITSLIDAGTTDDGMLYLVMDFVDGQRIDHYCDVKKLSTKLRLNLFLQVCEAVQFAHQNAVIHRDLKPSNILVSHDGEAKLIDFGIAKLTNPQLGFQSESTRTLFRVLTPEFASPEQARGEPPTTASDVYSLGIVLYGLLTGKRPYELDTTNPQKLLQTIETVQPEHPRSAIASSANAEDTTEIHEIAEKRCSTPGRLQRELDGDLSNIVLMALRKEPERRYQTAAQFADDIRKYLSGHPVKARKDTLSYRTSKFVRRNRVAVALATTIMLTLVGGMIGTSTQWMRAEQESRRASQNAAEARKEAERANSLAKRESAARIAAESAQKQAARAAKQARLRADTSREVSDFMVRLFQGADKLGVLDYQFGPSGEDDGNPTSLQLLARGKDRLDVELKDQPVVRATLKTRIAQVYMSLGSFAEAESLLESALQTQRENYDDVLVVDFNETLATLGVLRYFYGDLDAAKELLGEAITLCDSTYGRMDPRGANTKLFHAMVSMEAVGTDGNSWVEAKKAFRHVVEIRENQDDASAYDLAHAYIGEAIVERTNGNLTEATKSLTKAFSKLPASEANTYLRAWQLGMLATFNLNSKRNEVAYEQTERLLKLLRELLGEQHPAVAYIQIDFAWRIYRAGDLEKSKKYLREGLALARSVYGRQPRTAYVLSRLGMQLRNENKQSDEAMSCLREAAEIYRETLGSDHSRTKAAVEQLSIARSQQASAED